MDEIWRNVIIYEKAAGRRIDAYLAKRFPSYSRTQIVRYIHEGRVVSETRKLKASSILLLGERLRLYVPGLVPSTAPPPLPEILYEDDRVIVVNKPSGMLVHPSGDRFVWALIGLFKTARPDNKVDLVHRIDRETSGALLLSKDKEANSFIKIRLADRGLQKVYRAIVRGNPDWDSKDLVAPIGVDPTSEVRLRRKVIAGGQYCHTTFNVIKHLSNVSLIECHLHTGRTHQIRVHMEHLGYPLLGDKLYGQPDELFIEYLDHGVTENICERIQFPRHCLHASSIGFPHPNGGYKRVHAPLPKDMQSVVSGNRPNWNFAKKQ
jgi:23S rRNA pseudouridine1911/1915/1917 synthase